MCMVLFCGCKLKCTHDMTLNKNSCHALFIYLLYLGWHITRVFFFTLWISILSLYSLSGRRLTAKSRSNIETVRLDIIKIVSLWNWKQASRQRYCRGGACEISKRMEKSKVESRDFETSRNFAVTRRSALWIEVLNLNWSMGRYLG